ncbi:hypothetical protein M0805_005641 [Coniferiporia weirii]|nr:hypothetical protein M0805_005641 [Coniferiporia weirii]
MTVTFLQYVYQMAFAATSLEVLRTIVEYAEESQAVQYSSFASAGLLVSHLLRRSKWLHLTIYPKLYDYLITFSNEVDLVWYSKWSSTKLLFFATRYLGFVTSTAALIYYMDEMKTEAPPDLSMCGIVIAEIIMILRVYALWGKSRRVLLLLVSLLSVGFLATIAVFILGEDLIFASPAPGLPPCLLLHINTRPNYIGFGLLMAFEFAVMLMTFWKGISYWNERGNQGSLFTTFYRDGALYFVFLFALTTANFVICLRKPSENLDGNFYNLVMIPQRALHSIITARMILNLREAALDKQDQTTATTLEFRQAAPPGSEDSDSSRVWDN